MPVRNERGTTWRQIEHRSHEEKRATLMFLAMAARNDGAIK